MGGIGQPAIQYPSVNAVFNPARYYAETNAPAVAPTAPGAAPGQITTGTIVLIIGAVFLIWLIERHRLGLGLSFKARS
jgi:hypothetical protein